MTYSVPFANELYRLVKSFAPSSDDSQVDFRGKKNRRHVAIPDLIGTVIADRYEIISLAGAGGMGTVYRARQVDLDRIVAIKLLDASLVSDDEMFARFQLEAKALSKLSHQNIGAFFNYGVLPSGLPYIVMEYLEGLRLRTKIQEQPLSIESATRVAIQIAEGMRYAHDAGLIHRDLKPDNIILLSSPAPDFVKIVDFGLAKHAEIGKAQSYTQTGDLVGTPQYFSPEQCRGERLIDKRSDIYALGCVMYEMYFGHPPFDADAPLAVVHMHLNNEVQFPNSASDDKSHSAYCAIIKHCMQRNAIDRYQDMEELVADLKSLQGKHFERLAAQPFDRSSEGANRTRPMALKIFLPAVLIALGGLFFMASRVTNPDRIDSRASVSSLIQRIKAEKDGNAGEEKRSIKLLKDKVSEESAEVDRGQAFLDVAMQLQNNKAAQNEFAINAMIEALSLASLADSRIRKFGSGTELKPANGLTSMVVANANISGLRSLSTPRDQAMDLKNAEIVDHSAKILMNNGFVPDKNLILRLAQLNRLQSAQANYGLSAFNYFIVRSAEKIHLQPSPTYLEQYRRVLFFLRKENKRKELDKTLQRAVSMTKKVFGAEHAQVAQTYLAATSDSSVSDDDVTLLDLAAKHADKYAKSMDPSWIYLYVKLCSQSALRPENHLKTIEYANRGLSLEPDELSQATLLNNRGGAYAVLGKYDKALVDQKRAYELANQFDLKTDRVEIIAAIFRTMDKKGERVQAEKFIEHEISASAEKGAYGESGHYLQCLAAHYAALGDSKNELNTFERAEKYYARTNNMVAQCDIKLRVLQIANQTNSSNSDYLQEYLHLLKEAPNGWLWNGDQFKFDEIGRTFDRYRKKGFKTEIAASTKLVSDLTKTLGTVDAPTGSAAAIRLLESVKAAGAGSPEIDSELLRVRALADKK